MHKTDLNKFYSSKRLGTFVENGHTFFRLFAPRAEQVILHLYNKAEQSTGEKYKMKKDEDGVWETELEGELYGKFYGFQVINNDQIGEKEIVCIDPYAKAIASLNNYLNPRKAIVVKENDYEWEGDEWIQRDWRDLIIYEMHVRDITAHKSSGAKNPGTFKGLIEKGIKGGIEHIKNLGINTVEFLPVQEFGNIEVPFNKEFYGKKNTWNPYETNHWGYMTAGYFAPESYYSEGGENINWGKWSGKKTNQINELKDVIKEFHKNGIAVIMDVVYNHYSEYELAGLKEIDKEYYFRINNHGKFESHSFTGNDLKTERPMVRRMIVDSVLYWMKEFHIDGFRFDMAHLIDWITVEEIIEETQKINPGVILIAEPWGNGYDPAGFSLRGFASWNDQVRNGIKGENPVDGKGWIFNNRFGNNDIERIKSYLKGTLVGDKHGLFQRIEHSVNYLESHDGYTLGDFIRIATGKVKPDESITDPDKNAELTSVELKLNKLAALFLFVSHGIIMIHSGQEFARSKVISTNSNADDKDKGKLDHNSYEKDNDTNYINYDHAELNKELVNYYKGLIAIRNNFMAFRRSNPENIFFYENQENPFSLSFLIKCKTKEFTVAFNTDHKNAIDIKLPDGKWEVIANAKFAGKRIIENLKGKINVGPISGMILLKK